MKRYDFDITKMDYGNGAVEITENENSCGEYVKHDEASALLKEAYEAIVDNHKQYDGEKDKCVYCNGELFNWLAKNIDHEDDCIVLKAEQWLKENR